MTLNLRMQFSEDGTDFNLFVLMYGMTRNRWSYYHDTTTAAYSVSGSMVNDLLYLVFPAAEDFDEERYFQLLQVTLL